MENEDFKTYNSGVSELQLRFGRDVASSRHAPALLYLRRQLWNVAAMGVGDSLAITLALFLAGLLRWWFFGDPMIPQWTWLLILTWWGGASVNRLLPSWGMGAVEELRRVFLLLVALYSGVAVVLFLGKQSRDHSRTVLFVGFILSVVLVPAIRNMVKRILIRRKVWGVPTVIYGEEHTSALVIRALHDQKGFGYTPVGVFSSEPLNWERKVEGLPVLGDMRGTMASAPVAILAQPGLEWSAIADLLDGPLAAYPHVVIIPNIFQVECWLWVCVRDMGGVLGLEIAHNLLDPVSGWTKRLLEEIAVAATAVVWLPLCLLLALAVWLEDRANPFFLQERVGKDGRKFKTLKFRTMVLDAEQVLRESIKQDPALRVEWQTDFKLARDPRITFVGRIMRKASLDELPQLVNVLRGEMSLVGPRPLPDYHHEKLPAKAKALRERVRPGMTGMWQVSGRSNTGTAGMERWDTYYVRNWSVWLDIVILVRTLRSVAEGHGAR